MILERLSAGVARAESDLEKFAPASHRGAYYVALMTLLSELRSMTGELRTGICVICARDLAQPSSVVA
jgi:hypothetical protein